MKINRLITSAALAALLTLTACGAPAYNHKSTPAYHATCTDNRGYVLADWRCTQNASGARWSYEPYSTYQSHLRSNRDYYRAGRPCTCGTTTAPRASNGKPLGVQYAGQKNVTVFKSGHQAGTPIKTNQDAKKTSTLTRDTRTTTRKSSWGSTKKSSSSTNRSSYSSPRRR